MLLQLNKKLIIIIATLLFGFLLINDITGKRNTEAQEKRGPEINTTSLDISFIDDETPSTGSPEETSVYIYKREGTYADERHMSPFVSGTLIRGKDETIYILSAWHVNEVVIDKNDTIEFSIGIRPNNHKHTAILIKNPSQEISERSFDKRGFIAYPIYDLTLYKTNLPPETPTARVSKKNPKKNELLRVIGLGAQYYPYNCLCSIQNHQDIIQPQISSRSGCSGGGIFNALGEIVGVHIARSGKITDLNNIRDFLNLSSIPENQRIRVPINTIVIWMNNLGKIEEQVKSIIEEKEKIKNILDSDFQVEYLQQESSRFILLLKEVRESISKLNLTQKDDQKIYDEYIERMEEYLESIMLGVKTLNFQLNEKITNDNYKIIMKIKSDIENIKEIVKINIDILQLFSVEQDQ